jgi:hypothetical protein
MSIWETGRCPECHVLEGHNHFGLCSMEPNPLKIIQRAREVIERANRNLENLTKSNHRLSEMVTMWQGKFRMVVAENNKLRRKNRVATVSAERADAKLE